MLSCWTYAKEDGDMGNRRFRVRPADIRIPDDDPFRYDCLGRKESVDALTRIVSRIEGPCVLALDAPWGYGKTTFLRMWEGWLRQEAQGFSVVACFNAWETDFTNCPFLALTSELTNELESCIETAIVEKFKDAAQQAQKVLRVASALAPLVELLQPGTGMVVGAASSTLAAAMSGEADTNSYQEPKEAITNFKERLGELAQGLEKPLVVMIDELDRCRPSYAVELLEVAKHLFAVDNVVFVLAVNLGDLAHSVNALYGAEFCAEGYLRRFFDLHFRLPEHNREDFMQALLRDTGCAGSLSDDPGSVLLRAFAKGPDRSLRDLQQAVHRLGLISTSLPAQPDQDTYMSWEYGLRPALAVILRAADFEVYSRFLNGMATDQEVIDAVFGPVGAGPLPDNHHTRCRIEAYVIVSMLPKHELDLAWREQRPVVSADTPAMNRYREMSEGKSNNVDEPAKQHADGVLGHLAGLTNHQHVWEAVSRTESFLRLARSLETLIVDE